MHQRVVAGWKSLGIFHPRGKSGNTASFLVICQKLCKFSKSPIDRKNRNSVKNSGKRVKQPLNPHCKMTSKIEEANEHIRQAEK
jgi:hypothetical protein